MQCRRPGFHPCVGKTLWRRKWQPTLVFLPGESQGHGLTKSRTQLSDFTLTFTSNYGGGNEDNGDLLQKVPRMHCLTQCPRPCSRPSLTHASTRDSWTLMGKSGSVSCGVTAPFSWILVHTSFCLCPQRVCFPALCKFWQLYGGVIGNLPTFLRVLGKIVSGLPENGKQ